ncbi:hypothetical protein Amsp01_049710 [Amycolatopsis sp. NBRC 101858]|uniref:nuclear transport factor 2 family protein n=1 Tax=Amycolatopsis sp. NBRC 101858 TaxID=3032200 RepID=UPI0024A107F5|nr:nuclear transport factor 2 family protein [Amycolatopsis sp. NBRC 101858]GLY38947.1 hypothetical protein Amsp01_049710 [Amycolatopsis sp. NBRC 101858]
MTTTVPTKTAEIAEGVRATLAAYCHALDDGRTDDLVALFAAEGISVLPGQEPVVGTEALRAYYETVKPAGPQRHVVGNTLVTGSGAEAEAISDLVFLKPGAAGWTVVLVGRYEDRLRLRDGRWLFTRRTLTIIPA